MAITDKEKRGSYRRLEARILDSDDLHEVMKELPQLLDDADKRGFVLVIEVWVEEGLAENMARHWK